LFGTVHTSTAEPCQRLTLDLERVTECWAQEIERAQGHNLATWIPDHFQKWAVRPRRKTKGTAEIGRPCIEVVVELKSEFRVSDVETLTINV
jgi:hypothetical protein